MASTPSPSTPSSRSTPRLTPSSGYTPVATLAKGGLGIVELVLRDDGHFRRLYAMKRLHPHMRDEPEIRAMFLEEARVAGLLHHPNVVGVLDVGEDDQGPFLVMEFVDGLSLYTMVKQLAKASELSPIPVAIDIVRQAAEGLRAAHELVAVDGRPMPLVHRDVSPQNILVGFDGIVRVVDFGIAKAIGGDVTTTRALKGKHGYMSPEQLRFERLDARSDLFSLGVVTYELLTGNRLYPGREIGITAPKILHDPPPELLPVRSDAPPELERIVFGMLTKDRERRTPDAASLIDELAALSRSVEAEEGPADLRKFLQEHFGEWQARAVDKRAEAVRDAVTDSGKAVPIDIEGHEGGPRPARSLVSRKRRTRGIALGVVLAAAVAGGGTLLLTRLLGDEPQVPREPTGAPAPEDPGPAEGELEPAREDRPATAGPTDVAADTSAPEPDPGETEQAEQAEQAETTAETSEPGVTKQRRRRPRSMKRRKHAPSSSQKPDDWWEP